MAVVFISKPNDDVNVTGQPLVYTLNDSVSTPVRYIVQIEEATNAFSTGTEVAKVYISPNASSRGVFDLSSFVDGRLELPVTVSTQGGYRFIQGNSAQNGAIPADGIQETVRKYTLKVGRLNTDGTEDLNDANTSIYLIPGVRQISEGLHPSFADFHMTSFSNVTKRGWLTVRNFAAGSTQYIDMHMADEDQGAMCLLAATNMGITSYFYRLQYTLKDIAGTTLATQTAIMAGSSTITSNYKTGIIGPEQMETNAVFGSNWDDDWHSCEITPQSAWGARVGATLRIYKDCRPIKHKPVQIAFTNWAGGWDLLRFDGRAPKTITKEAKTYQSNPLTYGEPAPTFQYWDEVTKTYHQTATRKFRLNHNQFTADERDMLEYLMRAKIVYFRYGTDTWQPCKVDENSLVIEPAASKMFNVSLTITQSQPVRC
tara:strand:+ start:67 stop:1350 length:1284 start_codon:yes stop_codon:yes gene_type:complete